ncbi:porin family protein [Photobacterium rosenbergii]|uniref:Porin family protein n=1 Tax=Photobacterium rosenbergii TaxID=294936 RepID=A0ABU3ZIH0_9GAMM|nr:porin family protein [Photobacterium rosenbergii]MDV5169763.1 porin family protein [Photobacterium rosenbergii]
MKNLIPALLLLCPLSSYASSQPITHEMGLRLGGGGMSNNSHTDGDAGFTFELGYNYHFNRYFSLDTGYFANSGGLSYIGSLGLTQSISSYNGGLLGIKAEYPLTRFTNVYARGGINYAAVDLDTRNPDTRKSKDNWHTRTERGFSPYIALGTELALGQHFGISVEYQRIELPHNFSSNHYLLGINFKF